MYLDTLSIVGVGFIGGSVGLATQERKLARRIIGVDRNQEILATALARKAITEAHTEINDTVASADLTLICLPVPLIPAAVSQVLKRSDGQGIVSDVGSSKVNILKTVDRTNKDNTAFIGGHPLAGSEKTGVEHSRADLFKDKTTILTKTETTSEELVKFLTLFWNALGSKVETMTPEEHDEIMAFTSHMPHMVSFALAGSMPMDLLPYTSTGFRDVTRLASSDLAMWSGIAQSNRENVVKAIDYFQNKLTLLREALASQNNTAVNTQLQEGKKVRHAMGS